VLSASSGLRLRNTLSSHSAQDLLFTKQRGAHRIGEPLFVAVQHLLGDGLLIVNTGNGKGKTTAALGLLLRATGRGMRVGMFQFIKSAATRYGEHIAAERLGVEIIPLGDGFTWLTDNIVEDQALAEQGWMRVKETLAAGTYDVLILDELTYCLTYRWLDEHEVITALQARPIGTHVVVTGRDASPALIEAADLVTEMRVIKHPYREQGIAAQPGIEL